MSWVYNHWPWKLKEEGSFSVFTEVFQIRREFEEHIPRTKNILDQDNSDIVSHFDTSDSPTFSEIITPTNFLSFGQRSDLLLKPQISKMSTLQERKQSYWQLCHFVLVSWTAFSKCNKYRTKLSQKHISLYSHFANVLEGDQFSLKQWPWLFCHKQWERFKEFVVNKSFITDSLPRNLRMTYPSPECLPKPEPA